MQLTKAAIVPGFVGPRRICAAAETVGSVDTAFKLLGPDHKVVVEVFDDPRVGGVSCYLSRAKTGGIKGAIGMAEDKAESSVACRQVGALSPSTARCRARKKCSPSAPRSSSSTCAWCAWSTRGATRWSTWCIPTA